jgi:hypothetical protein
MHAVPQALGKIDGELLQASEELARLSLFHLKN